MIKPSTSSSDKKNSPSDLSHKGGATHGDHHHLGGLHLPDPSIANIRIAFFLNISFSLIEFVGAYFSNSIAIITDAIHDLGDSLALGLAWGLAYASSRGKTHLFTYGFQRLSLLGALLNTIILFSGSILVMTEAFPRLWNPQPTHAPGMLALAILGIAVNGYAVYRTSSGKNLNERTVSLHLLEDVLGWVAVAIISVVMMFTDLYILDPLLSLLIVGYIFWRAGKNFKTALLLFLQASPSEIKTPQIKDSLADHPLVKGVHDVHIWSLDGSKHILSAHIVVGRNCAKRNLTIVKGELKEKLRNLGIDHATLEMEFDDEDCLVIDTC